MWSYVFLLFVIGPSYVSAVCTPTQTVNTQQSIIWDVPDTTGTTGLTLLEYTVEQQQDAGSFTIVGHISASLTTFLATGLQTTHTYTWRVSALWRLADNSTQQSVVGADGIPAPCVSIITGVYHLFVSVQPSNSPSNTVLPSWTVQTLNTNNNVVTDYNGLVSIALGTNPGGSILTGVVSSQFTNGVKTWCCDLRLNKIGVGYNFVVTASGIPSVTTGSFTITGIAPGVPTNIAATPLP